MKKENVCVCLNGSEKRKNVSEMMSKSAQTFRFLFGSSRLTLSTTTTTTTTTAITIIVIAWCRCHHCYRRLSVSMIFSTCVYWIVHNMGPPHYAHVHHPAGFASKCVSLLYHIWPLSFQLCAVPCHVPYHAECTFWDGNVGIQLLYSCTQKVSISLSLSAMVAAMVLKSTHTLSAFSNNFTMCEEFRSLPPSLSYFFQFHPLTSIHYVLR